MDKQAVKLAEFEGTKQKAEWVAMGIGSLLLFGVVVFIYIKFGSWIGGAAFVICLFLCAGSLAAYVWRWYRGVIVSGFVGAGILLALAAVVYAIWGAALSKWYRELIGALEKSKDELPADSLDKLRATLSANTSAGAKAYVKVVKQ